MFDNSNSEYPGRTHFSFVVGGDRFCFAYIRKNACSALKRFVIETSPHRDRRSEHRSDFQFLRKFHAAHLRTPRGPYKSFFVYRDPFERIASLYLDKLVLGRGSADIVRDVAQKSGRDPLSLSFQDFVQEYLSKHYPAVDVHCLRQVEHLLPIVYDRAIPIADLKASIADLVGHDVAREHFGEAINSNPDRVETGDVSHVTAGELRETYLSAQTLPSYRSLMNESIRLVLDDLYQEDRLLVERISSQVSASRSDPALAGHGQ
jgi:hypothetical protein